jgi:hypothetical protein
MIRRQHCANDIRRDATQFNGRRGEVWPFIADDPRELQRIYPSGFD